ncbi:MAG: hypothetical protein GKC10_06480 [Methanosarcinales archaeon]|nr:hypothetical protein [Methanosarcinales archaeon]
MDRLANIILLLALSMGMAGGEGWYDNSVLGTGASPYFSDLRTHFTDPFFSPYISPEEERALESQYYPYFGEEFFDWGTNHYRQSQDAIRIERQRFESPYYPYFGEKFLTWGEGYTGFPFEGSLFTRPQPVMPTIGPLTSEMRFNLEMFQSWDRFQKNWTRTQEFLRGSSSLRVFRQGSWVTP